MTGTRSRKRIEVYKLNTWEVAAVLKKQQTIASAGDNLLFGGKKLLRFHEQKLLSSLSELRKPVADRAVFTTWF